jgi:hypothetical protein
MRAKKQSAGVLLNDDVEYWKTRAELTRVLAEKIPRAESREAMLQVANDCQRMAQLAEERLQRKSS